MENASNPIDSATIQFHTVPNMPINIFETRSDLLFGILNIKMHGNVPAYNKPLHFLFTIDISGSMDEYSSHTCSRSKLSFVKLTIKKIVAYLIQLNQTNFNMSINVFDDQFEELMPTTLICSQTEVTINNVLSDLTARGSTDIGLALKNVSTQIQQIRAQNPDGKIVHIFLTDGEVTSGEFNVEKLKASVSPLCDHVFIGYGEAHDAVLLSELASKNQYIFIDNTEKTGEACGEFLHKIIYKSFSNAVITMHNAQIYDFVIDSWVTSLCIGDLVSEEQKYFQIRAYVEDRANVSADISSIMTVKEEPPVEAIDLSKFILRQRTQEYLYKAKVFALKVKNEAYIVDNKIEEERLMLVNELTVFFQKLKQNFDETNDNFIKILCDDIYVVIKSANSDNFVAFALGRQVTQGRQYTNTCDYATQEHVFGACSTFDAEHYELSDAQDSPYITYTCGNTMRQISTRSTNI